MSSRQIDEGNIGDFRTNQVLEWTPITFTVEFIYRMRKLKEKLLNLPSTRQAIAIPKLLTAMYYRKVMLIPDDFIKAAVITTPIEVQDIAKQVAFEIIFSQAKDPKASKASPSGEMKVKDAIDDEDIDFMDEILSEFSDAGLDLDNLDVDMDESLREFESLMEFIEGVYNRASKYEEPYHSIIEILEQRSGYTDIMGKNLNSVDPLKEYIHNIVKQEMNSLSSRDIASATKLGWGKEIMDLSTTPWIQATTQYCMKDSKFQSTLNNIMKNEDVGTAARTARYLKDAGLDPSVANDLANRLIKNSKDLMDIMEISLVLEEVPQFDQGRILKNSLDQDSGSTFNLSRHLDNKFGTNLTDEVFKQWAKDNPSPTLPELFQAQTNVPEWGQMLNKCIENMLNDIQDTNGQASYNMADLAAELMQLSDHAFYNSCSNEFKENAKIAGMQSLKAADTAEMFENSLRSQLSNFVPLDQTQVLDLGIRVGLPETTIMEIFGGSFELLKSMIEQKIGNFQRYYNIIKKLKNLTKEQMQELMQSALSAENFQGMGALGHHNLGQAFDSAKQFGDRGQQQLAESLSAGPGDNLLLQWFMHRRQIPAKKKNFVRSLVKDAMINIALSMISNQRGSGEKGLIPSNKLRIFMDGDEMDLIDVDASIENIIMQGKSLDLVTSEDLLVSITEKGRVSICFLLDISGSMTGMKLAACSIAVMVLIGSLKADEVAICFFESNTHVVKEFGDEKNLEDVADELLDLHATGGTRVQAALRWGAKQLEQTATEFKICFLLTDCEFFEREQEIKKELEAYVNQKVKFLLGVNTRSYSKRYAKWILETTLGEIVFILNIMDIPKVLTETLEKIG